MDTSLIHLKLLVIVLELQKEIKYLCLKYEMNLFRLNWAREYFEIRFMTILYRKRLLCRLSYMNIFFDFTKILRFKFTSSKKCNL
jgi:hypothetical protein